MQVAIPSQGLQENAALATRLDSYADLLEIQGEDGFRVRAYRAAATTLRSLSEPVRVIALRGGLPALVALPTIGRGIAAALLEMVQTGHWAQLDRLRGDLTPERTFRTLPGVGSVLAERFATSFDAQSLEDLEVALRDPKMHVSGLGARRRAGILAALEARLAPIRRARTGSGPDVPPVALLLEADALYRARAEAGTLRKIAPRRFNTTGEATLPILHLRRGDWHLTLLYSNSARAHALRRERDWVVIFHHHDTAPERQSTVVTETTGPLRGLRVVRGREAESARHYGQNTPSAVVSAPKSAPRDPVGRGAPTSDAGTRSN
ncbi:hypothetical protein B6V74_00155 [Thioclava sp. F42-5]|uniref:DNA-binding protein n=1 Tax=Thioclava sp. F42-5 TaxID=1973005 RepID=UPI000B53B414|nr:DNA-binding protein [Thioclava sp. F42-5]OWY10484.1 hypothetical protein B6V74_00155 [Thioclava sp. F42-5]